VVIRTNLPPDAGPLVEIRDLHLNFNTFDGVSKVLAGVNLTLEKGDVVNTLPVAKMLGGLRKKGVKV